MHGDKHQSRIRIRASRDRLIDLLGLGQTYPLQDPEVDDSKLKVPFDKHAKVPVDPGQADVKLTLRTREGKAVDGVEPVIGNGELTLLETPAIRETSVTFSIHAQKLDSGLETYLRETATVRAGLDQSLSARIIAPPLQADLDNPADTFPRIIDYEETVVVQVDGAQEGVGYRLVEIREGTEEVLSVEDEPGLGPNKVIELRSHPIKEDATIRVRATSATSDTDSELLDIELPLAVRANRAVEVSIWEPVIAFRGDAALSLEGSQTSTEYQVWMRPLADRDFAYLDAAGSDVAIPVEDEPEVRVRLPGDLGETPEGYQALESWRTGRDDLPWPLSGMAEDSIAIVQARKQHKWKEETFGTSLVQLTRAAVVLVAPDPDVDLELEMEVAGASVRGEVTVSNGTPGIFYTLRRGETGADREPPAYFHQLDASNPQENKGIGLLRVEGDLALTRDPSPIDLEANLAELRPLLPLLDLGRVELDIDLHVRATKARTRVSAELSRVAALPKPAEIKLEEAVIAPGSQARVQVLASKQGERYELFLDGEVVKRARNGNGQELVFLSDPVNEETTFEVHVTQPDGPGLPVTRIVRLTARVS